MANTCLLSDQSKHYLCCYYQILDEMVQAITTAKLTQSIPHNFIVQMIPHQRAAIRMGRNLLSVPGQGPVRRLAQGAIDQQALAVDELEDALSACGGPTAPQMDLRLYQRRADLILRDMFSRMAAAPEGNRLEAVFLQQMLPHCRGAAELTRNVLRYDASPELEPILRSILAQQRRQIARMEALRNGTGCK